MAAAVTKGKIARKYLAHYIDSSIGGDSSEATYVKLGKDLEEFNTEFNAEVETKKNIWGEQSVNISGYEATDEVKPYYLEADDPLSTKLIAMAHERPVLDDLKTTVVDVLVWKGAESTALEAFKEVCYIELVSIGGDTTGTQTSFKLHRTGQITKGTFDTTTKKFSPAG